jgi:outer membrane protein insertion porin family
MNLFPFKYIIFLLVLISSCTIIKNAPKNKPYLVKVLKPEIIGGQFTKAEKKVVQQRLLNQLDDSSKANYVDKLGVRHILRNPVAYDSVYSQISARNMQAIMFHLGYYNAKVKDTAYFKKNQVTVKYIVTAGNPTLIDTVNYRLKIPELQSIAVNSRDIAILSKINQTTKKQNPVTKTAVLAEISRLVDSFRNNGYYKFTAAELRVRGDSSIAALTSTSDDPFEQLELLNEAQRKRDSPTVKLAIVLVKPEDTTKLNKYFINKIYVLSDFRPGDNFIKSSNLNELKTKNLILRYHEYLFRGSLLERNITMHPGDAFKQTEYQRTINNLSRLAVWQSVNIRIIDNFDEPDKIDLIIELLPAKKFTNVNSLDLSYLAAGSNNNAISGNLFGLAAEFSLTNKNVGREAIQMKNSVRGGIEFNNKKQATSNSLINSNEISVSNSITVPRLIFPFKKLENNQKLKNGETYLNTNVSYSNRLNLFNLQSINIGFGYSAIDKKKHRYGLRLLNAEFSYLYNQSFTFDSILNANPYLRYSYNTSFVIGSSANYSSTYNNPKHPNSISKERNFRVNLEESGLLLWRVIPILEKYKKRYLKLDAEYKYTVAFNKSSIATRGFLGLGIPLAGDSALPFFKQFYGGGSNSMRGWPIRGIGRGSQKLIPFVAGQSAFNDRTGDMQIEGNIEFRHDITPIFSWLKLKGALFVDAGNVWNLNSSKPSGVIDETQIQFKNLYKELGLSAGYGFRFDASLVTIRADFGFRFKRPETSDVNNGWKAPDVSFDDIFQKLISKNYRQWRYENFNFSFGINYPF